MVFGMGSENEIQVAVNATGTDEFGRDMDRAADSVGAFRGAALAAGGALLATTAAGFAASVNAARGFEDAMVGVRKVTDDVTAAELSGEIREMARTMPIAATELATIAEVAGQLGVSGSDNISTFTETVAQMSVALDMGAEQAATSFARIANALGTPIDEVGNMGDTINELSNNAAASGEEILDAMTRAAPAAAQLGMSFEDLSGTMTTLVAAGMPVERAGTQINTALSRMSESLPDVAAFMGQTTDEFATFLETDPNSAFLAVVDRLNEMESSTSRVAAATEIFGSAGAKAVLTLSTNTEELARNQEIANGAYVEGTSLATEYAAATDTFNSRLQITKNRLNDVFISVGNDLLPAITNLLGYVNIGIERFASLNTRTEGMAGKMSLLTGAVAGLGLVLLSLVGGPVTLAIGAAAALGYAWTQNFAGIRDSTDNTFAAVQALWATHGETTMANIQATLAFIQGLWAEWGDEIMAVVRFLFDGVGLVIVQALDGLLTTFNVFFALLRGDWEGAFDLLTDYGERTFERFSGFLGEWFGGFATRVYEGALNAARDFGRGIREGIDRYVPSMPNVSLPALGSGGIVTRPTQAIVGEAGAEAVIPLDRLDAMGGGGGTDTVRVILDTPGDGPMSDYIQEQAEVVVERDAGQESRQARRLRGRGRGY